MRIKPSSADFRSVPESTDKMAAQAVIYALANEDKDALQQALSRLPPTASPAAREVLEIFSSQVLSEPLRRMLAEALSSRGYGVFIPPADNFETPTVLKDVGPATFRAALDSNITEPDSEFERLSRLTQTSVRTTRIGVFDAGFDSAHPALSSKIVKNPNEKMDGIDNDGNGFIDDVVGPDLGTKGPLTDAPHGTHVLGLATQGSARIQAVVVQTSNGNNSADAPAALEYLIEHGATIVNVSANIWRTDVISKVGTLIEKHPEVLFVFSAGNAGIRYETGMSPQLMPATNAPIAFLGKSNVAIVGAATAEGKRWIPTLPPDFTPPSGMPQPGSSYGAPWVTHATIGVDLFSSANMDGEQYRYFTGTSMAAPTLQNMAAKLKAFEPAWSPAKVLAILTAAAAPIPDWADGARSGGVTFKDDALRLGAVVALVEQGASLEDAFAKVGRNTSERAQLRDQYQKFLEIGQNTDAPSGHAEDKDR